MFSIVFYLLSTPDSVHFQISLDFIIDLLHVECNANAITYTAAQKFEIRMIFNVF